MDSAPELQPSRDGILAIAATFTAEPLLPGLSFVLDTAGLVFDVRFAPTIRCSRN